MEYGLLLLVLVQNVFGSLCPVNYCVDNMDAPLCAAQYTENNFSLREFQRCPKEGELCDMTVTNLTVSGECKVPQQSSGIAEPNKIDQDSCLLSSECASKVCEQGYCVGFDEEKECSNNFECKAAFYCHENKCTKRKENNEECTHSRECQNEADCVENICLPYYSVPTGSKPLKDFSNIRSAGRVEYSKYCYSGFLLIDTGICEDLEINGTEPFVCNFDPQGDNSCPYISSISKLHIKVKDSCVCKMDEDRTSLCRLSTLSQEWKDYREAKLTILRRGCPFENKYKCRYVTEEDKNTEMLTKAKFEQTGIEDYPCLVTVSTAYLQASMALIALISLFL